MFQTILISMLINLFLCLGVTQADVISVRADEWCPFNCSSAEKEMPGYLIEVIKKIFEKKGHTIDYQNLNWARSIDQTRQGRFSAIVGAFQSDAPDFIFPRNALGEVLNTFFVKKGNTWKWDKIESLEGKVLGVINNYSYGEEIDEYIKKSADDKTKLSVISGDHALKRNLEMLKMGRIHTTLEVAAVMKNFLRLNPEIAGEIEPAGHLKGEKIFMAFSPKNQKSNSYAKILDDGIEEMRKSGELSQILAKYGLKDWSP